MAPDAICVGDPGRALALAQHLMTQTPRMSNHARGLWGYTGETPGGSPLTIQATGMGGPSATVVLEDLSELGVQRVIRIGTCAGIKGRAELGEVLVVKRALGTDGVTLGLNEDGVATPDPALHEGLAGAGRQATIASVDRRSASPPPDAVAVDLQTAAVLAVGRELGIAAAALLVVERAGDSEPLDDEALAAPVIAAGERAAAALSSST
jgi:purine-nucleoside phosphorylase